MVRETLASETAVAEVEARQDEEVSSGPRRSKVARRNRGNLPEDLPRIEQVIEPASLDCPCGCGSMHRIGEDRSERLDIVPAQLRVIVTVRPSYACRTCAEGITQAPARAHLIERGLPTEGAIAHVLVPPEPRRRERGADPAGLRRHPAAGRLRSAEGPIAHGRRADHGCTLSGTCAPKAEGGL